MRRRPQTEINPILARLLNRQKRSIASMLKTVGLIEAAISLHADRTTPMSADGTDERLLGMLQRLREALTFYEK